MKTSLLAPATILHLRDQLCSATLRDCPFPAETHFLLRQRRQQYLGQPVVSWIVCTDLLSLTVKPGWRLECKGQLGPCNVPCRKSVHSGSSLFLPLPPPTQTNLSSSFPCSYKGSWGLGAWRGVMPEQGRKGTGQQEFYQRVRGTDNLRTWPFFLL